MSAFSGKKLTSYLFVKILAQSHSRAWFFGTTVFYENSKFDNGVLFSNTEHLERLQIQYKEYQPTFFPVKTTMFLSLFQWSGGHQSGHPDVHFTSKYNLEIFYDNYWILDAFTKQNKSLLVLDQMSTHMSTPINLKIWNFSVT